MSKFTKVEVDGDVTTYTEQDNKEVEAEIIEAMKEGQAKIAELESENKKLTAGNESLKKTVMERLDLIAELEDENEKLRIEKGKLNELVDTRSVELACARLAYEEATKPKPIPEVNRKQRATINDLRKRDTPGVTKTCACCTRRCSWKSMDWGKSDFCDKCLGK